MNVIKEGYRWTSPGQLKSARCRVCGARCTIARNVLGPTCFAEALAKRSTLHDRVACPHGGSDWHNRAFRLRRAMEEMPSPRVAALMKKDLEELVKGRV